MLEMAKLGNINSASDLAVGAKMLETGIWGAMKNVEINLKQVEDEKYKADVLKEVKDILKKANTNLEEVGDILLNRNE
jgi:glutamate formiminotransferase/formiminotetrahydrofolate cyclodeaminase